MSRSYTETLIFNLVNLCVVGCDGVSIHSSFKVVAINVSRCGVTKVLSTERGSADKVLETLLLLTK